MSKRNLPRNITVWILALTAVMLFAGTALAAVENPMVMMVAVKGNNLIPSDGILAMVKQTQVGLPLDINGVKADIGAIASLGYFSEIIPEFLPMLGGVQVVFHVVEFPVLKEIKIIGLTKMPMDEAMAVFTIKFGQVINRNTMSKDLGALFEKAQKDYGLVLKSPSQRITPEGAVEVTLIEMKLKSISVTGLVRTKEKVVRRVILVKTGEIFDTRAFKKDLQNLFMLGFFEAINPTIAQATEPDMIDVIIECKERKTGQFMVGLTYSTGDGELAGLLKVGDTNFFGTGNSFNANLEINADKRDISLNYVIPWLGASHTSVSLKTYYNYNTSMVVTDGAPIPTYYNATEIQQGLEIGVGQPFGQNLTLWVTGEYQLLNRAANGPFVGTPPANAPMLTSGDVVTDSVSLRLDYKDLTPQEGPKYVYIAKGLKGSISTEFAGGFLGGDTEFQKYQLDGAYFISLSPQDVIGLHLMGGYVNQINDPFGTSDILMGGAETIRGYDYREFSGTQVALANIEYRHRFTDALEAVIFYDQGWFNDPSTSSAGGYGIGIRYWVSFLGQLRLDYGWPTDGSGDGHFYFALGEVF